MKSGNKRSKRVGQRGTCTWDLVFPGPALIPIEHPPGPASSTPQSLPSLHLVIHPPTSPHLAVLAVFKQSFHHSSATLSCPLNPTLSSSPGPPGSCSPDWPREWRTHLPSAVLTGTHCSWCTGSKGAQPSPPNRSQKLAAGVCRAYRTVFRGPSNSQAPLVTKQEALRLEGGTSFENFRVLFSAGRICLPMTVRHSSNFCKDRYTPRTSRTCKSGSTVASKGHKVRGWKT